MKELNIDPDELQRLKKKHKKCKNTKHAYRLNALILLAKNYTYPQIEDALLLNERTVRRWKEIYINKGIDEVLNDNATYYLSKLVKGYLKIQKLK